MHVLILTLLVCYTAVDVAAWRGKDQLKSELEIEDVQYSREETGDRAMKGVTQLTDQLLFQLPSSPFTQTTVSLLLFDGEEREWREVSVHEEEKQTCFKGGECEEGVTLRKPLIGYDLLKPGGCEEEEFKQQAFTKGRWGEEQERQEKGNETPVPRCYLILVSRTSQSTSMMYPENCAERETSSFKAEKPGTAYQNRKNRNTATSEITQFSKAKINQAEDRKFVCKLAYSHSGGTMSLENGLPAVDVKVYYKSSEGAGWGSPLLDLQWDRFSGGVNRFVSVVSKQHLKDQGVKWNKCFKCEVTVSGSTLEQCINCSC